MTLRDPEARAGLTKAQRDGAGRLKLAAQPLVLVGAYDLHAYCRYKNPDHGWDEFPWESDQCETLGQALAQLRRSGWVIHRDGTGSCPKCVRALGLKAAGREALTNGR